MGTDARGVDAGARRLAAWGAAWGAAWNAMVRAIEGDLLGWTQPPMPVALAETPLVADPAERWCLRCGQTAPPTERTAAGCASCRGRGTRLAATVRVGEYGSGLARRILETKHGRWEAMACFLGDLLGGQFEQESLRPWRPDAVVPVPMPTLRRLWRGIDHAEVIAEAAAGRIGVPVLRPLRQRLGATQVGRSPTDRRRHRERFRIATGLDGPFVLLRRRRLTRLNTVAVVDDVRTTGATLEEVARLLRELGVRRVVAAVVAVVPAPNRRGAEPDPP